MNHYKIIVLAKAKSNKLDYYYTFTTTDYIDDMFVRVFINYNEPNQKQITHIFMRYFLSNQESAVKALVDHCDNFLETSII